jgi:archaellum component FlaG (FlaF/FlaG flagellin family)
VTGNTTNKALMVGSKALFIALILTVLPLSAVLAADNTIDMVVSPNVLNIESNGGSISIHTDIGYVSEDDAALEVNETPIETITTFVDNRGNLVVKCSIDTVKNIVVGTDEATFVLTASYNGSVYYGTDTIAVIQVLPQK